ncbi:MAG: hypothetical protein BWX84_02249 [Verrucomicrobia bacterium ADurb.Bin118]|nr:MAG: hypothetical protein BWX84_02249 [Verrucomicrobia bacterium ADurb.Bin118]
MPLQVEVQVNRVHQFLLRGILNDPRRIVVIRQRHRHGPAIHRGPSSPPISGLQVVKVRAFVHAAAGMPVEECSDLPLIFAADLIVPAQTGQLLIVGPSHAVGAGFPIEFAHPGVFGEQVEKSPARHKPRLRIGEFLLPNQGELRDVIGADAAVFESGSHPPAAADEHPDITLIIQVHAGIVVGIIHALFIMNNGRAGHHVLRVVVIRRHDQEMPFVFAGAAIDEEGFIHLRRVNGQG